MQKNNNVNIAYSGVRLAEPRTEKEPWRNSIIYIGRTGEIAGIYDKNHLTIEENTDFNVKYGTEAKVVSLDFGKVASAICFDLNFDELMYRYKEQNPDLICFSSIYHGNLRQAQWAYTCRSYLVSSISNERSYIMNPYGDILAKTTNYDFSVCHNVNLDYAICHLDYNASKIDKAKEKYKSGLSVYNPGYFGSVMLTSEIDGLSVKDIIKEFDIELVDDYFKRAEEHRNTHLW